MKRILLPVLLSLLAAPLAAQPDGYVQVGDFWLHMNVDPMTDESRPVLYVNAAEASHFQPVTFAWVCTDNGLEAGFSPGRPLGRGDTYVQTRFDRDTPSEPMEWVPGVNVQYAFVPPSYLASFTRRALAADRLVLRAWDSMDNVYTFTFSMQGLTRGLRQMPCGAWVFERD
jgi:hypothetical protein